MHYYKRNIGDYAKKAARLSMMEHGAYTLLLDSCYDRERFPTKEEAIQWAWARTLEEIAAVEFVLSRFFTEVGGIFVQNRIKEEVEDYQSKAITNKRIAQEREDNRKAVKNSQSTNRERTVNEPPPNQEPLTNNQEPVLRQKKAPPKFTKPTLDDLITEFGDRVPDSQTQAEKFLSYYESNGWKVGKNPMKSWQATVTTWVTRSKENANKSGITSGAGFSTTGSPSKISTVGRNSLAADNYRRKLAEQREADRHNDYALGASGADVRGQLS